MGFKCDVCGQYHEEFPMDLAYKRPGDYFKIPKNERSERVHINEDICVIDDKEFYIRGIIELPVKNNSDTFRFGTWARINKDDFEKYLELWDATEINEPPFLGQLSGGIGFYEETDKLEVNIYLQSNNDRPKFKLISKVHLLGIDQEQGISMEKVHQFVEPILNPPKSNFWKTLFGTS